MNLLTALEPHIAERPDALALVAVEGERERTVTFGELDQAARCAATLLTESGIGAGDGVIVLQPMSIDLYIALLAIFRVGAVALAFDSSAGRVHIARCCERVPPKGVIASSKAQLLSLLSPALRHIPHKWVTSGPPLPGWHRWLAWRSQRPAETKFAASEDSPALITFTSGTTGLPKAAVRTHGFLLSQHAVLADALALKAGEIDLGTLPIFVLANLASGLTSVIPDADLRVIGAIDPAPVLAQTAHWHPDRIAASPTFLLRLVPRLDARRVDLPTFRTIYTGGGPVFPAVVDRVRRAMPEARIIAVYGSTEAEPIAHFDMGDLTLAMRDQIARGAGLPAGAAVPQINLRVICDQWGTPIDPLTREAFDALATPPMAAGEIVVSGAHVLQGYLDGVGDLENKFRVEGVPWHRTGDAGYFDESGQLWLLGRCSAKVTDENGATYPLAVEAAARHDPAIANAAFVALEGQRILVIESERPINEAQLRARLAWARIDRIVRVKAIPVDARHNAKVDYPRLRRLLGRRSR